MYNCTRSCLTSFGVEESGLEDVEFHPSLIYKVVQHRSLKVGDKVRLSGSVKRLKKNQQNHGEWVDHVKEFIGKIGSVINLVEDTDTGRQDDVTVVFAGGPHPFVFNVRSVAEHVDEFEVGAQVLCVIKYGTLKDVWPNNHNMQGIHHLKSKCLDVRASSCCFLGEKLCL